MTTFNRWKLDASKSLILLLFMTFPYHGLKAATYVRSLSDVSGKAFDRNEWINKVLIVFQVGCEACRKQVKQLQCLDESQVILVGAFASEPELRMEYRRMRTKYPAFYGSQEFLKELKVKNSATPQILVIGKQKNILALGLTSCEKITEWLQIASQK